MKEIKKPVFTLELCVKSCIYWFACEWKLSKGYFNDSFSQLQASSYLDIKVTDVCSQTPSASVLLFRPKDQQSHSHGTADKLYYLCILIRKVLLLRTITSPCL